MQQQVWERAQRGSVGSARGRAAAKRGVAPTGLLTADKGERPDKGSSHAKPSLKLSTGRLAGHDKAYKLREGGWDKPSHISFHPTTKNILRQAKRAAKRAAGASPMVDLTPQGNTHRVVYGKASEAVLHRAPPQKPVLPEDSDEAPLQGKEWLAAQMELTRQMTEAYAPCAKGAVQEEAETKKDAPAGAYVPKPRRTQRAKQKPQPTNRLARPTGLGMDGHVRIATGRRMMTGRRRTRVDV